MNSFTEKLLNELLRTYAMPPATNSNTELEIRFRGINRAIFTDVYNAVMAASSASTLSLECSTNIISENIFERGTENRRDSSQYIRKITFVNGVAADETYMQKKRLLRPVEVSDYLHYTIALSSETTSRKFNVSTDALMRFKVRLSWNYNDSWRIDMTQVRQCSLNQMTSASIKSIRNDLFISGMSPATFMSIDAGAIDSYEIEIENTNVVRTVDIKEFDIVKTLFTMINPEYTNEIQYRNEIYHIASYIYKSHKLEMFKKPSYRLKQLSNQVIAMSKNAYYTNVYPPIGWYVTIKTDGIRAMISINGDQCRVVTSNDVKQLSKITNATATNATATSDDITSDNVTSDDGTNNTNNITIVDAEIYNDTAYIFDIIMLLGVNYAQKQTEECMLALNDAATVVSAFMPAVGKYVGKLSEDLEAGFRDIYEHEYPFPIDGVILIEPSKTYAERINYKWKSYEQNTIDFLAVKCPQKLQGKIPYVSLDNHTLHILFVGITQSMRERLGLSFMPQYGSMFPTLTGDYRPIQFSPSANTYAYLYQHRNDLPQIDRSIVELSRDADNANWVFHKIREDRRMSANYYGNDFEIAELTYLNYIDIFKFENLWLPSASYFAQSPTTIYTAANKMKRFVISVVLKDNFTGAAKLIDQFCGLGADMHRYQEIQVKECLFIDNDIPAIAELIRRKFSIVAAKKRHVSKWMGGNQSNVTTISVMHYDRIHDAEYQKQIAVANKCLTVHTLVADMKTEYMELVASVYQFGYYPNLIDGIVCNFALHYMCDNSTNIQNLLMFNAHMMRVNGIFMFTVMDGAAIFKLLEHVTPGQQWESRENDVIKYAIKRIYTGTKLAPFGQIISVKLPFSDTMYEEPLCNVDAVISVANKIGFAVELNASMGDYLDRFSKVDRALSERLSTADAEYIALHRIVTLRLVKKKK